VGEKSTGWVRTVNTNHDDSPDTAICDFEFVVSDYGVSLPAFKIDVLTSVETSVSAGFENAIANFTDAIKASLNEDAAPVLAVDLDPDLPVAQQIQGLSVSARALVRNPRVLLLDEPFSALDAPLRLELGGLLKEVKEEVKIPILLITHDLGEACRLGEKMIIYSAGRVVESGSPLEIFTGPLTGEVRRICCGSHAFPGGLPGMATA